MNHIDQFFQQVFKEGKFTLVPVRSLDDIKEGVGIIADSGNACHALIRVRSIQRRGDVIAVGGMTSIHQDYNPTTKQPRGDQVMTLNYQFIFDPAEIDKGTIYMAVPTN